MRKAMIRLYEPDFEALCKAAQAHLATVNLSQKNPTLQEAIDIIEDKDPQHFCEFVVHPPSILAEKVAEVVALFMDKGPTHSS